MGLAGRKVKQRIPADPRNLSWADDASRFGQAYLSKFGWDASRGVGLGASGEGMTSHLKVSQKLDFFGIGVDHQRDPHGIAWKQNKDFEALLKRLNEGDNGEVKEAGVVKEGGFVCAREGRDENCTADDVDGKEKISSKGKDKKRKRKDADIDNVTEGDRKKKKKKRKDRDGSISEVYEDTDTAKVELGDDTKEKHSTLASSPSKTVAPTPKPKIKGRPMAHRARIQAAKSLANKSVAAISEILGIAPSSTTPSSSSTPANASSSTTPDGSNTPTPKDTHESLEKLTTSTKSLADYLKDKLAAKKSPLSTLPHLSTSSTPPNTETGRDDYDTPRGGLGMSRTSSRPADEGVGEQQARQGLGFAPARSTLTSSLAPTALESIVVLSDEGQVTCETKGKKKRKKDREVMGNGTALETGAAHDLTKTKFKEAERLMQQEKETAEDATSIGGEKAEKKKRRKKDKQKVYLQDQEGDDGETKKRPKSKQKIDESLVG